MPVPVATLQDAARPLTDRVYEFLAQRPDQGFSLPEIIQGTEHMGESAFALAWAFMTEAQRGALLSPYEAALRELQANDRVVVLPYRGVDHFAVKP